MLTDFDAPLWQQIASLDLPPAPPTTVDVRLTGGELLDFGGGAEVLAVLSGASAVLRQAVADHRPRNRI